MEMSDATTINHEDREAAADAILLLAHGTPDVLGDMRPYLERVTGGRPVSDDMVRELQERYAQIGLADQPSSERPHLTKWTFRVADLLEVNLGKKVYVGMRNWKPFISDVVQQMIADGVQNVRAICMAPQNSRTSVGLFKRALEEAVGERMKVDFVPRWSSHPILVDAFAQRLRTTYGRARTDRLGRIAVLFTAHSVPTRTIRRSDVPVEYHGMVLATSPDSYESDCRETANLVAARLEDVLYLGDCYFSFQSQGMSGGPWIGPSVEDMLFELKTRGYETVILQPIGFLCDHVEVLYDIDIVFRNLARDLGIELIRPESLNDSSLLIDTLEDLVNNTKAHEASDASIKVSPGISIVPNELVRETA
jgi:ferrochelatase